MEVWMANSDSLCRKIGLEGERMRCLLAGSSSSGNPSGLFMLLHTYHTQLAGRSQKERVCLPVVQVGHFQATWSNLDAPCQAGQHVVIADLVVVVHRIAELARRYTR